jgi:hypothetical protein
VWAVDEDTQGQLPTRGLQTKLKNEFGREISREAIRKWRRTGYDLS